MAKRIIYFSAMLLSLSACIPGMNGYYPNQQGYYGNHSMQPAPYGNNYQAQSELPQNFGNLEYPEYSNDEYAANQVPTSNPWEAQNQAYPQNFAPEQRQFQPKGIVGIGQSLPSQEQSPVVFPQQVAETNSNFPAQMPQANASGNKLIAPSSWRMAHPSIGNGLELINQSERFNLNNKLNDVKIKHSATVTIGGNKVTVLGLNAAGVTNLKGFLCKEAYLVQPQRNGQVATTWGKFCRHPNWNEWVLTKW